MNTYTVWVTETIDWEVEIEASSEEEAMRLAEEDVGDPQSDAITRGVEINAEGARLDKLDLREGDADA